MKQGTKFAARFSAKRHSRSGTMTHQRAATAALLASWVYAPFEDSNSLLLFGIRTKIFGWERGERRATPRLRNPRTPPETAPPQRRPDGGVVTLRDNTVVTQ